MSSVTKLFYNTGEKIGELTYIKDEFPETINRKGSPRRAIFKCHCGNEFITRISGVKNGKVKSCGCTRILKSRKRFESHGLSESPTYCSWECLKARCLNPHNKFYSKYGGRGIKVCDRWLMFENFLEDMGERPGKEYSIDRIDVNGDYCPENCKWSNRYIQDRNKTNSVVLRFENEDINLCDLARKVGMHQQTIMDRIRRGFSVEEAVIKNYKYNKSGKYSKNVSIL